MKKFVIEEDFLELFPEARIGIISCHGIDNTVKEEDKYQPLLTAGEEAAMEHLPNDDFSSNTVIQVWREAFQKFKTKKGARCSIEALLKRVSKGNHIGCINPLVDIYNSISLKYALPCGGEDIDKFEGDIRLTRAEGGENFITLGSEESEPPYEGEVVYKDNGGAICRCWNWRESVRTMLTEETTNAFLIIELVDAEREADLKAALEELKDLVVTNLGGTGEITLLDKNNKEVVIDA